MDYHNPDNRIPVQTFYIWGKPTKIAPIYVGHRLISCRSVLHKKKYAKKRCQSESKADGSADLWWNADGIAGISLGYTRANLPAFIGELLLQPCFVLSSQPIHKYILTVRAQRDITPYCAIRKVTNYETISPFEDQPPAIQRF